MIFNPLSTIYKNPIGAVSDKETVTFCVYGDFSKVDLLLRRDGTNMPTRYSLQKTEDCFSLSIRVDVGLYFYFFDLGNGSYIGKGDDFSGIISNSPIEYQLTSYESSFNTPDWIKGGLIYQIFPDRFNRAVKNKPVLEDKLLRNDWGGTPNFAPNKQGEILNNDFFGGDILGIVEKLDYLRDLGVSAIYLNPIFKAYSNHRYDTGDYMQIDELLGNIDDFKLLIKESNDRGIKIILDGVFNHTGADSLYFNKYGRYKSLGAFQSNNSPYYNWFKFIDYPNYYESWWGIKTLPATDKTNSEFLNFIVGENGVFQTYCKLGIGGWRLDVVDELPPDFVKAIRSSIKSVNNHCVVIGEVWENASNKISYGERREYFQGKELDSVMNYPLKNAILDFVKSGYNDRLVGVINEQLDNYPQAVLHSLMNILSTHDTFRLLSALGNVNTNNKSKKELSKTLLTNDELEVAKKRLKVASLLQYTLYGVPCLYYGDEVGMQGYTDPLNRGCFPWGNEDKEILDWYIKLGEIRRTYSVFTDGNFNLIYSSKGVIVYKRENENEDVLVAINISNTSLYLEFDGVLKEVIYDKEYANSVELLSGSFGIFVNKL